MLYYQRIAPLKQEQSHPPCYTILPAVPNRGPLDPLPKKLAPEYASKIQALDRQIIQMILQWIAARRERLDQSGNIYNQTFPLRAAG